MNIAWIVLDSLRYDAALAAETPNFNKLIDKYQNEFDNWVQVGAHGTYTLPAHVALFHAGALPDKPGLPYPFGHEKRVFRTHLMWNRYKPAAYETPEATSVVKGFAKMGYRTLGIGGVHWFNDGFQTSGPIWKQYFDEFYWNQKFTEENKSAFEEQLKFVSKLDINKSQRLLFFINISSTHMPYMNFGSSVQGQAKTLEYVDKHINDLIDLLPKPVHCFIFADHGDAMGEDGMWGHRFYHPKVMEVPIISLEVK